MTTSSVDLTVITIVRGRHLHLHNQAVGLIDSQVSPREWVIVGLGEQVHPPDVFDSVTCSVVLDRVAESVEGHLPLAEARNRGAEVASCESLLFLDVDCIPDPMLVGTMYQTLAETDGLWMGDVRYLGPNFPKSSWTREDIETHAERHPALPRVATGEQLRSDRYELFWSLCFGLRSRTFETIGGFDANFVGYGGEDTDFAFSARRQEVPFGFVGASAYHQHHLVCQPPLQHLSDIVFNARIFREKWGEWPMRGWLDAFAEREYIEFDPDRDILKVLREPTPSEIEEATTSTAAGF